MPDERTVQDRARAEDPPRETRGSLAANVSVGYEDREQMELSDLLSRVLDKGVVIAGSVILSVADIDLVRVGLSVVLTSVETEEARERARLARDADASLLPPPGE